VRIGNDTLGRVGLNWVELDHVRLEKKMLRKHYGSTMEIVD
jgi:hypothetical protein